VARGVVYAVVGLLSLKLALGLPGHTSGQQGALRTIGREPSGGVLLVLVGVGLAGYASWRLTDGILSPRREGVVKRIAAIASGLVYGALCATDVQILAGAAPAGGNGTPKHATAGVLGWTAGPELVGAVGAALIGVAIYQASRGLRRKFLEDSETERMGDRVRGAFTALGVIGHLARAVVFALVGYGLARAAIDYSPRSAIGLDGALAKLARSSDGPVLLGIVAAGLLCFGLYSVADARYRRV
jgi:Domain of Unknown Function (DUF1206)